MGLFEWQWCRFCDAAQFLTPELFGGRLILLLQPGDIIAIGTICWHHRLLVFGEHLIAREELVEQQGNTPGIQNGMVEAPEQMQLLWPQAEQSQAQ